MAAIAEIFQQGAVAVVVIFEAGDILIAIRQCRLSNVCESTSKVIVVLDVVDAAGRPAGRCNSNRCLLVITAVSVPCMVAILVDNAGEPVERVVFISNFVGITACPSYPAESEEGLYCARGSSKVSIVKKGCNCPECPVWANYGLTGMYYCVKRD